MIVRMSDQKTYSLLACQTFTQSVSWIYRLSDCQTFRPSTCKTIRLSYQGGGLNLLLITIMIVDLKKKDLHANNFRNSMGRAIPCCINYATLGSITVPPLVGLGPSTGGLCCNSCHVNHFTTNLMVSLPGICPCSSGSRVPVCGISKSKIQIQNGASNYISEGKFLSSTISRL